MGWGRAEEGLGGGRTVSTAVFLIEVRQKTASRPLCQRKVTAAQNTDL